MNKEELREHCEKEIEMCEFWAIGKGEEPSGKIYEEHKLILELLEQESVLGKIRAELADMADADAYGDYQQGCNFGLMLAAQVIDKYIAEMEE